VLVSCAGSAGDSGGDGVDPPGIGDLAAVEEMLFVKPLPGPSCNPQPADDTWAPRDGNSGGIPGTGQCGHSSPCPTTYIPGNTGAPCASASDCTGLSPVCLRGSKYPGGSCAATGCELGSNKGCPAGDACINGGDGQTYCLQGCGYAQEGCFVHCARDGYSCFATESRSLGTCLGEAGTRQCDPTTSDQCDPATTGVGPAICVQTGWDDQSIGRCFERCHPIQQDCSRDGEGCYSLIEYSPYPVCFQNWGYGEGESCKRMTQCGEGLRCACDYEDKSRCEGLTNMHCRYYCATSQTTGHLCNAGETCRPLKPGSSWGSCQPAL